MYERAPTDPITWTCIERVAAIHSATYALLLGDAENQLARLPEASIDTCLTSPPYWTARDYRDPNQIGLEADVDDYVDRVRDVFREIWRVLRPEGTAWLNIGDTYFHGAGTVDGKPPRIGWKRNKQLVLVPFRVALALQEDGWWVRNTVVWQKPNAMPASVTDRFTNTWEPVFLLAKSEDYYFDLDAVRIPHVTDDRQERRRAENGIPNGKAKGDRQLRRWLNSPRHRATIEGLREIERRPSAPDAPELAAYLVAALKREGRDIAWVAEQLGLPFERTRHYFRRDEIGSRRPPDPVWQRLKGLLNLDSTYDEAMQVSVGDNVFRNHPNGRNPGDHMAVPVAHNPKGHFAVMPSRLAARALRATLPSGGTCLDPFMGTGTTGHEAIRLGGRFVGVDLKREYLDSFVRSIDEPQQIAIFPRLAG
jgi:DNA modification methylase